MYRGKFCKIILYTICLGCLTCLLVISCRKKQEKPYHYFFPLNENLKRDHCYLPGTYWIYRDSITGRMDSFEVASTMFDSAYDRRWGDVWEEDNRIYIYDFNMDSPGSKPSLWEWELRRNDLYIFNKMFSVIFSYPAKFITYPLVDNTTWSSINGKCDIKSFPVFEINGISYNNVVEVHRYIPGDSTHFDHWFYMNSSAGIIKMKLNTPADTIVWEVQRYHMVR